MKKAVFFDRDGTLIEDKHYLNDPSQVVYLEGVFESLKQLQDAGFLLLVVTNQSGIARGLVDLKNMDAIHAKIKADCARHGIEIRHFYYAPFLDESGREERKPGAGMLKLAAQDFALDLKTCWMVGDKMSDIEAGRRAGCRSIFLDSQKEKPQGLKAPESYYSPDILEVARIILKNQSH